MKYILISLVIAAIAYLWFATKNDPICKEWHVEEYYSQQTERTERREVCDRYEQSR